MEPKPLFSYFTPLSNSLFFGFAARHRRSRKVVYSCCSSKHAKNGKD